MPRYFHNLTMAERKNLAADYDRLGPMHQAMAAYLRRPTAADRATDLYRSWLRQPLPQIAMPPEFRIAARLANGCTEEEEAAFREYDYRWNLAFNSAICFGVPHSIECTEAI